MAEYACSRCRATKPQAEFHRDARRPNGLQSECKRCQRERHRDAYRANPEPMRAKHRAAYKANPGPRREYSRKYQAANLGRVRENRVKRLYGLSLADVAAMLERQERSCAVCTRPISERTRKIDHDHRTGTVRGLLCHACNTAIGLLRECPRTARAAADYITESAA